MANTPTREHREAAVRLLESALYPIDAVKGVETIAQALADAEQRGYERGREAERADVTTWLDEKGYITAQLAIRAGKHLAKDGE